MSKSSLQALARECAQSGLVKVFALACAWVFTAQWGRADTITFLDLTDLVSVDFGGSTRISNNGGCTTDFGEDCTFNLNAPAGYGNPTFSGPWALADCTGLSSSFQCYVLNIGEAGSTDPNVQRRSDAITVQILSPTVVNFDMGSDPQPQFGDLHIFCADAPGGVCTASENGGIQTAFQVNWHELTVTGETQVDTIQFQSDVESVVPEPRFGIFLVMGLTALGLFARRKLLATQRGSTLD